MIIDCHAHLGFAPAFYTPDISTGTMLALMDRLHISKAFCSHMAMLIGDQKFGFKESLEAYEESDGRILLYTVFNPILPDSIDFVKKCMKTKGFIGIKIHPSFHSCPADDDAYDPIWKFAMERSVPILTHTWDYSETNPKQKYSFPALFEKYTRKYKDVVLILGHAGGRYKGHLEAARLAKTYDNVYLDLSGDSYDTGLIEYLVKEAGSKKILFGSDMNWIDPRTHVGRILDAKISISDKQNIFAQNALKIFGKYINS
jgi:predicted TIM-barrel fold metal-dependent hydrolase